MSDRYFLYKPIIGICKQYYTSLPCVARDVYQPLEWTGSESIVFWITLDLILVGIGSVANYTGPDQAALWSSPIRASTFCKLLKRSNPTLRSLYSKRFGTGPD